ncbi:MAG: AAA family ATPase, partial [bacterium]
MLHEVTVENFRAFRTRQSAPLAPITLIYGPNSGGKSTLINALLLMAQSAEAGHLKGDGPKVWLGNLDWIGWRGPESGIEPKYMHWIRVGYSIRVPEARFWRPQVNQDGTFSQGSEVIPRPSFPARGKTARLEFEIGIEGMGLQEDGSLLEEGTVREFHLVLPQVGTIRFLKQESLHYIIRGEDVCNALQATQMAGPVQSDLATATQLLGRWPW